MKLKVVGYKGKIEALTIVPPLVFEQYTPDSNFFRLVGGDGTEYYFVAESGVYDGWVRAVSCETREQAKEIIDAVEKDRQ